jgi:hypothetical protein
MDEVDPHAIDVGLELRQRVQLGFATAPVVLSGPIVCECLDRRQLHTLRVVVHQLLVRHAGGGDAAMKVL